MAAGQRGPPGPLVHANQAAIHEVAAQAQMPPGELNQWPAELLASFNGWDGS